MSEIFSKTKRNSATHSLIYANFSGGHPVMCISKNCCCFSLYTGALIISWLILLLCLFDGMKCIYILNSDQGGADYRFVTTAECILQVLNVLICMTLIAGVANKNAAMLLPWLAYTCLLMGASIGVIIIVILWFQLNVLTSLIIYILILGFVLYCWTTIYSLREELKQEGFVVTQV